MLTGAPARAGTPSRTAPRLPGPVVVVTACVVVAALSALSRRGEIDAKVAVKAIRDLDVDADALDPTLR